MRLLTLVIFEMIFAACNLLSQIINPEYKDISLEGKSLIIAPLLSSITVDSGFKKEYPDILSPQDSLKNIIESRLQFSIRKNSQFKICYSSNYNVLPRLEKRKLYAGSTTSNVRIIFQKRYGPFPYLDYRKSSDDDTDSIEISLPLNGDTVKMITKTRSKTGPDFILFLSIGNVQFKDSIAWVVDFNAVEVLTESVERATHAMERTMPVKESGLVFENLIFAFWDNKIGRIAAYNKGDLFIPYNSIHCNEDNIFDPTNKYMGFLSRYILTGTPFADPDMFHFE